MGKPEFTILVLGGDGIGPEVTAEATQVLDLLSALPSARATFKLLPRLFGGCSIDEHGVSVTEEVLEEGRQCDAILMGAVGGPKWDGKRRGFEGPEGATLRLREATDVYANIRPVEYFLGGKTPLKEEIVKVLSLPAQVFLSDISGDKIHCFEGELRRGFLWSEGRRARFRLR